MAANLPSRAMSVSGGKPSIQQELLQQQQGKYGSVSHAYSSSSHRRPPLNPDVHKLQVQQSADWPRDGEKGIEGEESGVEEEGMRGGWRRRG